MFDFEIESVKDAARVSAQIVATIDKSLMSNISLDKENDKDKDKKGKGKGQKCKNDANEERSKNISSNQATAIGLECLGKIITELIAKKKYGYTMLEPLFSSQLMQTFCKVLGDSQHLKNKQATQVGLEYKKCFEKLDLEAVISDKEKDNIDKMLLQCWNVLSETCGKFRVPARIRLLWRSEL